jgi:hypothetical protein
MSIECGGELIRPPNCSGDVLRHVTDKIAEINVSELHHNSNEVLQRI